MITYVPMEYELKVGDQVALELRRGNELLTVVQVSMVKRVEPSNHHKEYENINEVEF